jgi:hypothetical protein
MGFNGIDCIIILMEKSVDLMRISWDCFTNINWVIYSGGLKHGKPSPFDDSPMKKWPFNHLVLGFAMFEATRG